MGKIEKLKGKAAAGIAASLLSAAVWCFVCIVHGCTDISPDGLTDTAGEEAEGACGEYEKITVTFRTYVSDGFSEGTDMLNTKVQESTAEDVMIYVYCDGSLVKILELQESSDGRMELDAGRYYNYYATANIGRIPVPDSESSMKSGRVNVTPMEPSDGIPMAASGGFTVTGDGVSIQIMLKRLYSKILLSVDSGDVPGVDIISARIRQAATSVSLFSESAADEVADGDVASSADIRDLNGGKAIALYLPENCQGILLPSNEDSRNKIPENISGEAGICSYIEMVCGLDGSGDLSGNVIYRSYLGQDATSDFNVIRNTENHVTLKLSRDALTTPSWQVEPDVYADVPLFVLDSQDCGWYCSGDSPERISMGNGTYWEKVISGGQKYLAIGKNAFAGDSGLTAVSSDGRIWETGRVPYGIVDAAYGNGMFVGVTGSGRGYISHDGKNWNDISFQGCEPEVIVFGDGKFLAFESGISVRYCWSEDGEEWNRESWSTGVMTSVTLATFGKDGFLLIGNDGNAALSADGVSWSKKAMHFEDYDGQNMSYEDIVCGNGIYVMSAFDRTLASVDGFSWKQTGMPETWYDIRLDYKDGVFAAFFMKEGASMYSGVATSIDGDGWTLTDDIQTVTGRDICIL